MEMAVKQAGALVRAGALALACVCGSAAAGAAEVKVLSAGAIEPGVQKTIALFKQASGHTVTVQFNTAPQIRKRMESGYVADVLIAPPAGLEEQVKAKRIAADGHVMLGRVGVGVTVRASAPAPDIATMDAFKKAVLSADAVVYNTASTGLYLEQLFSKIGVADQVKAKTVRYPNGEAVMEHIIKSAGNQMGFGAATEIKMYEAKGGLKYVGPLPAEVQNYTSYAAALMNGVSSPDAAKALLAFLATPQSKAAFASAGIE
jgi:molybdate transport system substrate-binding protein